MKARRLVAGAVFGPDALRVIIRAFDAAWQDIATHFGDDPADVEEARIRLAKAVLSVAHEESRDAEVLKNAALQVLAQNFATIAKNPSCRTEVRHMPDKADNLIGGWVIEVQGDGLGPRPRYLVGTSDRKAAVAAVQAHLGPNAIIMSSSPVAPAVLAASKVGPGQVMPL